MHSVCMFQGDDFQQGHPCRDTSAVTGGEAREGGREGGREGFSLCLCIPCLLVCSSSQGHSAGRMEERGSKWRGGVVICILSNCVYV